jgi:hypothetical protein
VCILEDISLDAALPRKLDPQNWELIVWQLAVAK